MSALLRCALLRVGVNAGCFFFMDPVSVCHSLSPYIIGTTNQPVKMTPNHGLHLSFRWEP